jgi:hypothetical protein
MTLRLPKEWRQRLDVDGVLELGYLFHVANDPDATDFERRIATQTVEAFREMTLLAKSGSAAYVVCTESLAIIAQHGRAISREKMKWREHRVRANEERLRHEEKFKEAGGRSLLMSTFWKLLGPVVMGTLGYIVSQLLSGYIPERAVAQVGSDAPTLLLTGISIFLGRWEGQWWRDRERDHIYKTCDDQLRLADEAYHNAKQAEFNRYRGRLCRMWKDFTGEDYPDTLSYEVVANLERRTRDTIEAKRQESSLTIIAKALAWYRLRKQRAMTKGA